MRKYIFLGVMLIMHALLSIGIVGSMILSNIENSSRVVFMDQDYVMYETWHGGAWADENVLTIQIAHDYYIFSYILAEFTIPSQSGIVYEYSGDGDIVVRSGTGMIIQSIKTQGIFSNF